MSDLEKTASNFNDIELSDEEDLFVSSYEVAEKKSQDIVEIKSHSIVTDISGMNGTSDDSSNVPHSTNVQNDSNHLSNIVFSEDKDSDSKETDKIASKSTPFIEKNETTSLQNVNLESEPEALSQQNPKDFDQSDRDCNDVEESTRISSEQKIPNLNSDSASQISISISDPQKIGEGIGSYMVYSITTRTSLPYFSRQSMTVTRRFSDFLGLHSKLISKHGPCGRIVPPPPAKSAFGTAKVKMSKEDSLQCADFLEKRRLALERYLQRNAEHPILCADPNFREFLELNAELPRSTSTSALSSAGVKRIFTLVGDTVQKITSRMEESDPWFETKQQQIDILDNQIRKLNSSVESLIGHRKELTFCLNQLSKSTALISHDEPNVSLSCALSHLASTHEKIEKLSEDLGNNDFIFLAELLRDHIGLIGAIKEAFHERIKCIHNLHSLEQSLNRKKEFKAKLELTSRSEPRISQIEEEISEYEGKVSKANEIFHLVSQNIKQEFERFDLNRVKDFRNSFVKYIEAILAHQESLIDIWEAFLPEAKAISI
ncbi:sorting nexin-2-like protein [Sarcoptes scabiei]|uniref:Sorting nexin-2-like protein n=1 Tax=Sarcoptes scabiei TaxID=52283 RepID=A0A132A542_SARSC|nr:sorting nexin-2-like protein [Sarcoptes scabiei]